MYAGLCVNSKSSMWIHMHIHKFVCVCVCVYLCSAELRRSGRTEPDPGESLFRTELLTLFVVDVL